MEDSIQLQGCRLHLCNTEKFKNTYISMKFRSDLTRENTTIRSLLSMVLLGGTRQLPSTQALAIFLENMYGASLSSNVSTKGSAQIISLTSSFINDSYLPAKEGLFKQQLNLMKDILFSPLIENGGFTRQVVENKKRELKERLAALKDDKYTYAVDQTLDLMGKDDVLGISGIGYAKDIDGITAQALYQALQDMLLHDTIEIYAVGHFDDEDIHLLQQTFTFPDRQPVYQAARIFQTSRTTVQHQEEIQNITQAKFQMAFRANCDFLSEQHEAMTVFNGIFGAFSHSRLFKNVREKHSLCYYISSNYDAFNGIIMVSCGIEANQADKVKRLVLEQLNDIQNGHITDEELQMTQTMFVNSLQKTQDDPANIVLMQYNRDIVAKGETMDEYAQKLQAVTREEIVNAANLLVLDTEFLLKGEN